MREGREGRADTKQSRDDSESMNLNDTNSVFVVEQLLARECWAGVDN